MTAPRPEPVLGLGALVAQWQRITAAVVGVVAAGGAVAVAIGWATDGQVQQWAYLASGVCAGVGSLLAVLLPLVGAQQAKAQAAEVREQVTPLVSPRNVDSHALVDAEFYGDHAAKQGHEAN